MATFDDILNEIAPATYEKVGHQREDGRATVFMGAKHHPAAAMSRDGRRRRFARKSIFGDLQLRIRASLIPGSADQSHRRTSPGWTTANNAS
jgi:hypothetical protein